MRVTHYSDLSPHAPFSVTETLVTLAKIRPTISAVSHSWRKINMVESMKLRRKKYGAAFTSVDGAESSEPRLGHLPLLRNGQFRRKPSARTQLPVSHPDLGWITLQSNRAVSGSTNRFPRQLPRDAAAPFPAVDVPGVLPCAPRGGLCPGARPSEGPNGAATAAGLLCPSPGDTGCLRPNESGGACVGLLFSPSG